MTAIGWPVLSARVFVAALAGPMQIVSPGGDSATTPVPGAAGTSPGAMLAAGVAVTAGGGATSTVIVTRGGG